MAALASNAHMLPPQRIGRVTVVIERQRLPFAFDMAVSTQLAIGAFVDVVFFMAGVTVC